MSELLDAEGRPVKRTYLASDRCPACGAEAKHIETTPPGFGGYWSKTCTKCGHVVASGRGEDAKVPA